MRPGERSFRALLWALALVGLALDQASKYGVFHWLYPAGDQVFFSAGEPAVIQGRESPPIIPGFSKFKFDVQFLSQRDDSGSPLHALRTLGGELLPRVNQGALFGIGKDHGTLANTIFAIISVAAAALIIYWSTRRSLARDWTLCAALGLILAGTVGNLYDRLVFNGVRDFLHWEYLVDWPVFNIADSCLVCGAFILLLQAWGHQSAPAEAPDTPEALTSPAAAPANNS